MEKYKKAIIAFLELLSEDEMFILYLLIRWMARK